MRRLVLTPRFKRAWRKFVQHDKNLAVRIEETLRQLQADAFVPRLSAHKLSGRLAGLWACSCGHDCRIVFSIETDANTGQEVIILLDIGTHDEVY